MNSTAFLMCYGYSGPVTAKEYKPTHGGRPGKVWASRSFGRHKGVAAISHIFSNPDGKEYDPGVEFSSFYKINFHKGPETSSSWGCK